MSSPRFRRWSLALAGCRKPFLGSDHLWRESQEANSSTSSHESSFSQSRDAVQRKKKRGCETKACDQEKLYHTLWHYISRLYGLMSHCAALTKDLVCSLSSFCSTHRSTSCWRTAHQQVTPAGAPGSGGCADARLFGAHDTPSVSAGAKDSAHWNVTSQSWDPNVRPGPGCLSGAWCLMGKQSRNFPYNLRENQCFISASTGGTWRSGSELAPISSLEQIREASKLQDFILTWIFRRRFPNWPLPGNRRVSMKRCLHCKSSMNCHRFRSRLIALFKHWTFKNMFRENVFVRSWLWIQCISTNRF